jgi:hypothetical protein
MLLPKWPSSGIREAAATATGATVCTVQPCTCSGFTLLGGQFFSSSSVGQFVDVFVLLNPVHSAWRTATVQQSAQV